MSILPTIVGPSSDPAEAVNHEAVNHEARHLEAQSSEGKRYHARMATFYAATFAVVGSNGPYLPVWLDWRGLTPAQISIVLAAPMFGRVLFTPAISYIADRSGRTHRILMGLAWGTLVASLAFGLATSFAAIVLVATCYAAFWTTVIPLSEVVAMAGVRRLGLDYGRMRLWGSVSFIVASVGGGLMIARAGPQAALWALSLAALATVLAAYRLPRLAASPAVDPKAPGLKLADALALVRSPLFGLFIVTAALTQASHAVFYGFGTLHLARQGHSPAWIGVLWAVGVVCEIVLFSRSRALVAWLGPIRLMMIGALCCAIRWPLMALDLPLALLAPVQALHGVTFGATHLGAIHFISSAIPTTHAGTAQGLFATITGVSMGVSMLFAGPLYAALGGGAYTVMAVPAAAAIIGGLVLLRVGSGRDGVPSLGLAPRTLTLKP